MLLIKNITIYDGTGSDGYVSDILVDGDKIADKVMESIESGLVKGGPAITDHPIY